MVTYRLDDLKNNRLKTIVKLTIESYLNIKR